MTHPRLSLCLIVRNEAPHLAACLDSARPWVQEIVVVDTGSTDGTPELARQLGARVQQIAWPDDFAAARNVALAAAQGEWVLSLDADERLVAGTGEKLADLMAAGDAACAASGRLRCYRLRIHNHYDNIDGAPGVTVSYGRRLFPNHPRVRWMRPVHEYVEHLDGSHCLEAVTTDAVVIEHLGYLTAEYSRNKKGERNIRLLQSALAADPDDELSRFYLGQQLHRNRAYAEAAPTLQTVIARAATQQDVPSYLGQAYVLGTNALLQLGRWQDAATLGQQGMAQVPSPELACELGAAWLALRHPAEAAAMFRQARDWPTDEAPRRRDSAAVTWRPWEGLAAAALQQGEFHEALQAAREAHRLVPQRSAPLRQAALAAAQVGQWAEAADCARRALARTPDDVELIALLGQTLERLGQVQEAYDTLVAATARYPRAWDVRAQLADLLIGAGEPQAAVATLAPLLDEPPPASAAPPDPARAGAYAALARALDATGQPTEAAWARQLAAAADPVAASAALARAEAARLVAAAHRPRATDDEGLEG